MTLEPLHPIQAERLRAMTPAEKWEVAKGLLRPARETRRTGLALRHPDWSPRRIEQELARARTRSRRNLRRPLHRSGARYPVAGSVGAMIYSEPRLTIDTDLAVALGVG